MAVKLYPFQPHAQIRLEPWLVQRALDRLGDRRLIPTGAGNRCSCDADAYEGPMAGLVANIASAEKRPPARRRAFLAGPEAAAL